MNTIIRWIIYAVLWLVFYTLSYLIVWLTIKPWVVTISGDISPFVVIIIVFITSSVVLSDKFKKWFIMSFFPNLEDPLWNKELREEEDPIKKGQ